MVEALATSDEKPEPALGLAARELVQRLVARLKPLDRLLIRLVYLEGLSVEEASQSTGYSLGAVAMRISRAKAKMRKVHDVLTNEGKL